MAEKKDLKSLLKKVDIADTKVLVVGIILLVIPIVFLLFISSQSGQKSASSRAQDRLGMHKTAFSFQRKSSKHPAGMSSSASLVKKVVAPEEQWAAAAERIANARPYVHPAIAGLPKEKRQFFEAEQNPKIRMATALIAQDKLDEARAICEEIMRTETENDFLRFMASGNLCDIYNATGDLAALRKEFLRYLDLLDSLNFEGLALKNTKSGYLAMNRLLLDFDKIKDKPEVRNTLSEILAKHKKGDSDVGVNDVLDKTFEYLKSFPAEVR